MTRTGFRMRLKPGSEEEYRVRHDQLWPEMAAVLAGQGITTYTIFRDGLDLFAYLESGVPQEMGTSVDPVVLRWWAWMEPLMECNPDGSPKTWPMDEVFHFEPR